ncbi:MAG: Mercuric reductase [Alphaproteobacteria bacterium MarineAlpha11_Bin1]|nr:MAG: Mercuric reductase [Alphaproteobacteria bacterium MarineAlpha11_Bin1]|tara:strand:+ start:633 stop:2054 length:1422 start_codon:yes stop_codon:yes gene_type:complete
MKEITTDICVIGGGSGGLSVAAGASQMGAEVVLIEGDRMGGDCLNYGCVPSKSMIAAANAAYNVMGASKFGIEAGELNIDFQKVHDHVHKVIDAIAHNDSVERFEGLGVRVIEARGRFVGPTEVQADDTIVKAKRVVVSTGSKTDTPLIEGLDTVPYLTNKTIFDLVKKPPKLLIIGGGTIGSELGQAHRRLGCEVTILEIEKMLNNEDPELSEIVRMRMLREGVVIREKIEILGVTRDADGITIKISENETEEYVKGSDLLVVSGRVPDLADLNLDVAGIEYTERGIKVDDRLRTSNKKVFAIGDAVGSFPFTHSASYHAGVVIRNALFGLPAKVNYSALPRVTYTDPELAHVGLTERQAREKYSAIRVLRHPFSENDRARTEGEVDGLAKIITTTKGVVVGASIVGTRAGELIQLWILPIKNKMKIGTIAGLIIPYPTLGEVSKRAAGSFYTPKLFSEKTKKIVRFLLSLR